MRIFHIALRSDWEAARRSGSYTTSTLGRTLAEEGFIHASRGDQWQGVRDRFYADVTEPLVLLVVDTDRLSSPVVEETPPGADETFPHVYGPIEATAVVQVLPLGERDPSTESFSTLFLRELFRNVVVACIVLACVVVASVALDAVDDGRGRLLGVAVGLTAGVPLALRATRRWRA